MSILDPNISDKTEQSIKKHLKTITLKCNSAADDIVNGVCRACRHEPNIPNPNLKFYYNVTFMDGFGNSAHYKMEFVVPENIQQIDTYTNKPSSRQLLHDFKVKIRGLVLECYAECMRLNPQYTIRKIDSSWYTISR